MSECEKPESAVAVVVYKVVHMGLWALIILNTPLQTQGGGGGLEALSLSK